MSAFSIAFIAPLSYGFTTSTRGSGTLKPAICCRGTSTAVVVHLELLDERRRRPAGPDRGEVGLGVLDHLVHALTDRPRARPR